ncbi:hypothetical protein BDV35DRAFT_399142 [Aspergillus flavus]|uniref:Uncharacterized protein n=1 Tax=Aspergillus flavus TaxID=5059 RepID=A0A5N6GBS9_ASPFL|nr:hypothetical protein BDV35DRAFT_399142 [Aspergillus flavus]
MKYEDLNERGELRPWEENHIKSDIHLVKGQRWSPIHRTRKRQEKYSSFLGRCQRIGDHMFLLASLALGFRNYDKVNATDRDLLDQALRQCSFRSSKIEKVADGVNFRNLLEPRIVYSNVKIDKIDWLSQNDILINAIKNSSHVIHHITSNENRCCKAMQISMTTAYPGIDDAILTCRLERAEAEKLARMLEATEEWTI